MKKLKMASTSAVNVTVDPAAGAFYVGDGVKQEDIKAKFEDGTLKLFVPKEAAKPAVEQKKYISIEG